MSDLRRLIAQVVEDATKKGIERAEIAGACGELYSTFNRQVNPNDNIRFPAEALVPLINITQDPRIPVWLVSQTYDATRLLLVKDQKRTARVLSDIFEINALVSEFIAELSKWIAGEKNQERLLELVDQFAGELRAIRSVVKKGKRLRRLNL